MTKKLYLSVLMALVAMLANVLPARADYLIYFDNSKAGWATPFIHYWGGDSESSWPGMAMKKYDGNVWYAVVAPNTTGCLFNAGDGDPTKTQDFKAVNGHIYNQSGDQGVFNAGPAKPSIVFSPESGRVRGTSVITVSITSDPTSISGSFNGKALSLSEGDNLLSVADYLNDGDTATLEVTASNAEGSTTLKAEFYRSDAVIPTGPVKNLVSDYYKVNPDGKVGSRKTIDVKSGTNTGATSRWTADELIAQGVARDVCQAFRGTHERPIVDSYALYAAYDASNLYLGVQMVYTVWDEWGEGFQAGESKPYNMDGKLMIAFDLDPETECNGTLANGASVWFEKEYTTFANGMDALWLGSTKPGVGTPGLFMPNANGKFDYNDPNSCKQSNVAYGYQDGLLPSIDAIYGQAKFGYDPVMLEGNEGFIDLRSEVSRLGGNDSAHTFYEFAFPLADLGIDQAYIEAQGIGVMFVDLYGSSAHAALPYDPCFYDKVNEPYSQDKSTSAEKEDQNCITYSMARVGRMAQSSSVNLLPGDSDLLAAPEYYTLQGMRVAAPVKGSLYIVRQGAKASKVIY